METMVQQGRDFVGTPRLNIEEWAALLRSTCGGDHEVIDPNIFAGWMRRVSVYGVAAAAIKIQCGLAAVDHGGNAYRFERTRRDIRFADTDWYCALFQVAGRSWLTQNDHTIQLGVRDMAFSTAPGPGHVYPKTVRNGCRLICRASRSFLISDSIGTSRSSRNRVWGGGASTCHGAERWVAVPR
jgi:hypothetical protein